MIHTGGAAAKAQAAGGVRTLSFGADAPLHLSSGEKLAPLTLAYETYGVLNSDASNAVLICHDLHDDQFVASTNPLTGRPAWWPRVVGPGRPIDTNRFYVICSNVVGGSMGSTGPASLAPDGQPYGVRLPALVIADMVRAQSMLIEALGIESLFLVTGPGMGGMQALQWASSYPRRVFACVTVAAAARNSPQNLALNELSRLAILADPDWRNGAYLSHNARPLKGAAIARTASHITALAPEAVRTRFQAAQLQARFAPGDTPRAYVERMDANAFLYTSRAADAFDLAGDFGGRLSNAFQDATTRHGVFAFNGDWRYPVEESREIARALIAAGAEAAYVEIDSANGHSACFSETPAFEAALTGFIDTAAAARGLPLQSAAS